MANRFALDIGATRTMIALSESAESNVINYGRPSTAVLFTGIPSSGVAMVDVVRRLCRQWHVELDELSC